MRPNRRQPDPTATLLKSWSAFGQDLADFTGEATHMLRTSDGMVRFATTGWPIKGDLLATFTPKLERRTK